MNELIATVNQFAGHWWPYVLHATWQAGIVALLILLVVRLGRRWPAPIRYGLLMVALVKFALPPTLLAPMGIFHWVEPETFTFTIESAVPAAPDPAPVTIPPGAEAARSISDKGEVATSAPLSARKQTLSRPAQLMLIHAAGVLVLAVWILLSLRRLASIRRHGEEITEGPLHDQLQRLVRQLGIPPRSGY